jgi:flagellar hook assembly protein FlgD
MNNASMTQLLGRDVTAMSNLVPYDGDGPQPIHYDARGDVAQMTVTVQNAEGKVVSRAELSDIPAGEDFWTWDGKDIHGVQAPEGTYTVSITAFDGSGQPVEVNSLLKGRVNEMSYATGAPVPYVDGVEIAMASILRVETGGSEESR